MPPITQAVAYYRMSSDKQETSIGDQRKAVEEYARLNNYSIAREYIDEGISGWKSEQRLAFQDLISDASEGKFQAVLCWDQDRFSRFPVLEANHYWYLLDQAGVHIATVSQGKLDFADLGEWLKASVVQHGKSEYVRDLSRNVCRGMRQKRQDGRWFGPAPYGYQIVDGKLAPSTPAEIAVVNRIFQMRLAGYGTHLISKALNNDGIPTARGKRWKSQTVSGILERPAYVGDTLIGKFASGKFSRLADTPTLIKNTHPAIVDRETWEKVQSLPKRTCASNGRGGSEGARLSGLMFCGMCGGPMYSLSQRNGQHLYRCANYSEAGRLKDGKPCGHCAVKRTPFEAAVFSRIRQKLLMDDRDRLEAAIERELSRRAVKPAKADSRALERQVAKLDRQIEKGTEQLLLIDPDLLPTAQEKLRELRGRRDELLRPSSEPDDAPPLTARQIADKLWSIDEVLREAPPVAARHAMKQIVSGIVCDFDFDRARSTPKRKRYNFVGAEIVLRSAESAISPR